MNTTVFRAGAATLAAVALTAFVGACGDDSGSAAPATSAPGTSAAAAPSGGGSVALVDGEELAGNFATTCAKQGDTLALALTDNDNATYGQLSVSATLTGDDTVQAVGIAGSKGGSSGLPYAVGYGNGQPGGSAKVVKDGNTFKVTGEGVGAPDMTNPMAGPSTATFDITFACSTIVGG